MGILSRQSWPLLVITAVLVTACWRWCAVWNAWRTSVVAPAEDPEGDAVFRLKIRYLDWGSRARSRIAQSVLRGDLSLWEAAACYRRIDAVRPPGLRPASMGHRGASEEERLCRHVIRFMWQELVEEMRDDGPLLQLTAELDERVRRGDLRLPEPPGVVEPFEPDGP
jgi:hypothetical protein